MPQYLFNYVGSYLSDRTIIDVIEEGQNQYQVIGGIPQGSVLGPLLWNIVYDGVPTRTTKGRFNIIGYVDDIES